MKNIILTLSVLIGLSVYAQDNKLIIHNLGHASLMFEYKGMIIHIDPSTRQADYSQLPDADLVFVTHGHGDHYDLNALSEVKKDNTVLVTTEEVKNKGNYDGTIDVMENGDVKEYSGIGIRAVPAYNIEKQFHPNGIGNGFIFYFDDLKVYVAGDTEDIPEMKDFNPDIAFIPMNLPYTMTPEQAKNAALMLDPDILYIYHYGSSDTELIKSLLREEDMEVRIGESVYVYNLETGESKDISEE